MTSSHLGTRVKFQIEHNAREGETIWVVGSGLLGSWHIASAIQLTGESPFWSCTVDILTQSTISYKYFLRTTKKSMSAFRWENGGNRSSKIFGIELVINDGKFRLEEEATTSSVFADEGWLIADCLMNWRLGIMDTEHPGKFINPVHLVHSEHTALSIEVDHPKKSTTGAVTVQLADVDIFQTFNFYGDNIDSLFLKIKILIRNSKGETSFGRVIMTSNDFKTLRGTLRTPIFSQDFEIIGTFNSCFQIVFPFVHPMNSVSSLWESFKKSPLSLDSHWCGHRGCGSNTSKTAISENTILSFLTAAQYGADYVEFDVQLTSDNIPVIYHDYEISVNDEFKVPICQMTLNQFASLNPDETSRERKKVNKLCRSQSLQELSGHVVEKEALRSTVSDGLPTFEETLRRVPIEVGFMVEIKYPSELWCQQRRVAYVERNAFVDLVLKVVFEGAGARRIIFLAFDPDIALLLRQKQQCYPVLFLTSVGDLDPDFDYFDHRCATFDNAIRFAELAHLRGVVASVSSMLQDQQVVQRTKSKGLLFCTYGTENMKEEYIRLQKRLGVDAFIVDNIVHMNKKLHKRAVQQFRYCR